jgi:TIR domain
VSVSRWGIFVSYRRSDSADVTGRICDQLKVLLGDVRVFRDVDSIALGRDFREAVSEAVGQCEVLLAIIGKEWLSGTGDDGKRRLDDSNDYVHIEIASALKRGIPVVPVLVENAPMPRAADLPEPLRDLAFHNGTPVRPDPDFHHDVGRLGSQLKQYLPKGRTGLRRIWASTYAKLALCAAGVALLGVILFAAMSIFRSDMPAPSAPSSGASHAPVAGSRVPIRFWVEALPDVPGADPQKLFNNALGSWQAVVVTPIRRADSAAEANVLITTSSETRADAQIGPPKSGGAPLKIRFGSTEAWTPRTFEAASARMLGHILGLTYTDTPDQLMTNPEHTTPETLPLTPQSEDIQRVRQIWDE